MKLLGICLFLVAFAKSSPLPQSQESESGEPSLEQPAGHQMVENDEAQRALHVPKVHVPAHLSGIPILVYPGHHNMIHTGAQVHHQVPQHQKVHVQQPHHQQPMHHTQQQAHHAQQQMHHAQQKMHLQKQQMHHTQQHMVHQQHQMAHAMQSGHQQPQSEHEKMTQQIHQVPLTAYQQYNQYTVPYQYPVLQYYQNPYQHQFHQQYVLIPLLPEQAKSEVHDQMTHHKGMKKEGSDEDTVVLRNEELDADSESGGDTMEEEPKETMLDSIEVNADVLDNEDEDAVDIAG